MKCKVTITRSAYQNLILEVNATDPDEAEEKIREICDALTRPSYVPGGKWQGYKVLEDDFIEDEESSWEVLDTEKAE